MEDDWKIFAARMEAILPTLATKADVEALRAYIESIRADIARWTLATVIGLFIGFGGLFMAMTNALKPAPVPAPQAQPIVIYTPAAARQEAPPEQRPQQK
ncbi:hypothetical protein [Pseudoduganella aquatica]|uniref:Uncharacterized protein n=1 Tax=Pseudoduganella aquatica TaxID=2660641 RepID=A0A7X4HAY4_9BURK|nr:hypothetical protein [Pseudoduganella aquatica]MYN07519.1 hypothetical protein [Pseudoduganella aquatica]